MDFNGIVKKLNNFRSALGTVMKKRSAKIVAAASLVAILAASTVAVVSAGSSAVIYVDGEALCKVESRAEYERALGLLTKLHEENGVSDRSGKKITCSFKLSSAERVSPDKCAKLLYGELSKDYSRAYCISMKGIEIGFCATYSEAEQVVEHFREHIINSVLETDNSADSVELTTDFEITSEICRADRILTPEALCSAILNSDIHGGSSDSTDSSDRVTAGGSSSFLYADKNFAFGMLKNEAETELPKFDFSFNIGELNSTIEYKTYVVEKYSEIIPFETVTVETDELYVGQSKIDTAGENGLSENVYEIAYIDGVEVSKTLVSSVVISEPITCVKYVGTKEYPSAAPTGSFMWPVLDKFVITSGFGVNREGLDAAGTYHKAIDIAAPMNTPIYAADGGTVTFAGESGTYGLIVKITHENGVETRYAHMDNFDVKVGDKVYKGQKIGEIGVTGRVTGPHVHFEVRINGKAVNPRNYLPSAYPWKK